MLYECNIKYLFTSLNNHLTYLLMVINLLLPI